MVGGYLWYSGWRDIEIVTLCKETGLSGTLWVVRGKAKKEG